MQILSKPLIASAFLLACFSTNLHASLPGQARAVGKPSPQAKPILPVNTASTAAPGQAGYVHYFVITHPDGTLEDHVGIEMEDQRIAWSFPGSGVTVVDFIKNGTVESGGKTYKVEHLHAIRPLRSDREMQTLRNDLSQRVAIWIDNETPYCALRRPNERFCLSCGDFVVRILFPSTNPLSAGLPQDFIRTAGQTPTTDDLLLYMLGMHALPDAKSRLGRLATLDVPETLRRDLQDLLQVQLADESAAKPSTFTRKNPRIAIRKTQIRRL